MVGALSASREQAGHNASVTARLIDSEGIRQLEDITTPVIESYLLSLLECGCAYKTMLNHLAAINQFCNFLVGRNLLPHNPCRLVPRRTPEKIAPRFLDKTEYALVLRLSVRHGIFPEVALALFTGLRRSELCRLAWEDIQWEGRKLLVRRSKSRKPRAVPLSAKALAVLRLQKKIAYMQLYVFPARQTWRGGWKWRDKPRYRSWWLRALKPIQDAVPKFRALPGCRTGRGWHLFRHTFASRAVQAGVSIYKVAQWLGHSDVRTTQMYAHLEPGHDEEIEKV